MIQTYVHKFLFFTQSSHTTKGIENWGLYLSSDAVRQLLRSKTHYYLELFTSL